MTVDIICADCREALARFPDGHFHCCVTSPPFWGLRDYGLGPTVWGGDGCQKCQHVEMAHIEDAMTKVSPCGQCSCPEYLPCEHEWGEESSRRYQEQQATYGGQCGPKATAPTRPRTMRESVISEIKDVRTGAFCRRCSAWRGTLGLEPTPELYVEHLVGVMREVRRVLRADGTLWLNLGDSYVGGGRGMSEHNINFLGRGTGQAQAMNRWPEPKGLKPKDLVGIPWRVAFALQADGWWLRSDIVWSKPNPMPESVTDRPTRSHEYLFLLTKANRYAYDADAIREPHTDESAKRYLRNSSYTGDPNATQYAMKQGPRGHGMPSQKWEAKEADAIAPTWVKGHSGYVNADGHVMINEAGRNRRSVWEIATQPYPGAHFAVFPEKLVEPCILAGTSEHGCCPECGAPWERVVEMEKPPDHVYTATTLPDDGLIRAGQRRGGVFRGSGQKQDAWRQENPSRTTGWRPTCKHGAEPVPCRVLDPFAGSGTVGVVAERLGRHSVLIDAKEEYCEMARHRTAQRGLMMEAK